MSRYALALWFAGLAALGLMRFWLMWREAAGGPVATSAWLWLAGSAICMVVAVIWALRVRRQ